MKKYIVLPFVAAMALSSNFASAQNFDNDPTIKVDNKEEDVHFTVGARMMADAAYYHSDFTPVKSGASITDARIRTSFSYKEWYLYADFDFSGGKFSQKNLFAQWSRSISDRTHAVKIGYYNDPATMANNTSRGSLHFISRSAAANALSAGRQLGATYKFTNNNLFLNQGIFAENKYNNQAVGYQGVTLSGRWLYLPFGNGAETFHVGINARYAIHNTGEDYNGLVKTNLELGTSLETYVDKNNEFCSVELPWAKNELNLGAEALYHNDKFFARGEYIYKHVTKDRDDQALFEAGLGSLDSWGSLASWQGGNPLRSNTFHGAYGEFGYKLFGPAYKYNKADGVLGGLKGKSLELVARYSYVNLNDIVDGEKYVLGRDQYYPGGNIADYPATSTSVGGGCLQSATIGANYSFNNYVTFMLSYTYNNLNRDKYVDDTNFHTVQGRFMFTF